MVSIMTVVACIITLLISLVLPIAILIGLAVKNRKQGIGSAWLLVWVMEVSRQYFLSV